MDSKHSNGHTRRLGATVITMVAIVALTASCTKVMQAADQSIGDSPAPAAASVQGFPNESNTGVPAGVGLTDYTGPCTITTPNTVIDAALITCDLMIRANTTITRSKVVGVIDSSTSGASLVISDTEIDGGQSDRVALAFQNITATRLNIHGARQSTTCEDSCIIQDSYLHGQYNKPGASWHLNGYISNGGSNVTVRHNTIACDPPTNPTDGGCTGPAAIFGDFGSLSNITFDNNLFVAGPGAYCLYAGYDPSKPFGNNPANIVITNNVFQRGANSKCATYGPATSFLAANGNVWSNNTWDDGSLVGTP